MSNKYFGTDGIRGPVGGPVVNAKFASRLGYAVGVLLQGKGYSSGEILLGRDTRESGRNLQDGLAAGLAGLGFSCVDLGILPTPAIAINTFKDKAILGVSLTASHNPATDNGFKFFAGSGRKVSEEWEKEVENLLGDPSTIPVSPFTLQDRHSHALKTYCDFVIGCFPKQFLNGVKVLVDTANGATYRTTCEVLEAFGAETSCLGDEPDGLNINDGVGSEHPEYMSRLVSEGHGDLGLAHDGDGDRVVFCDEGGSILHGDEVLGIIGLDWMRNDRLAGNCVVGTVQCNAGLEKALKDAGGILSRTPVGDRHVTRRMIQEGLNFGGEPSGHFVLGDFLQTGDGLLAALQLLEIRQSSGKRLSELRTQVSLFPQAMINLQVMEKTPLEDLPAFQVGIKKVKRWLGERGRVLVRYSGTEPRIRLLAEGQSEDLALEALQQLTTLARRYLNTIDNELSK